MSGDVTVVFVKTTGHILAAVTRQGGGQKAVKLKELASPRLHVRHFHSTTTGTGAAVTTKTGEIDVSLEPNEQHLKTAVAAIPDRMRGKDLIETPRSFFVKDPTIPSVETDRLIRPPELVTIQLTSSNTINLKPSSGDFGAKKINVWAQLQGPSLDAPPIIFEKTIEPEIAAGGGPKAIKEIDLDFGPNVPSGRLVLLALVEFFDPIISVVERST